MLFIILVLLFLISSLFHYFLIIISLYQAPGDAVINFTFKKNASLVLSIILLVISFLVKPEGINVLIYVFGILIFLVLIYLSRKLAYKLRVNDIRLSFKGEGKWDIFKGSNEVDKKMRDSHEKYRKMPNKELRLLAKQILDEDIQSGTRN